MSRRRPTCPLCRTRLALHVNVALSAPADPRQLHGLPWAWVCTNCSTAHPLGLDPGLRSLYPIQHLIGPDSITALNQRAWKRRWQKFIRTVENEGKTHRSARRTPQS